MSNDFSDTFLEAVIDSQVKRFKLDPGVICRIGRDDHNAIVLPGSQISRNHAMIQCTPNGAFSLTDLGSRNGTFVNRRRVVGAVILQPGNTITIGSYEFVFHGPCESLQAAGPGAGETVVDFSERMITVLVADIRDFTGLSRRLPEAKLSEVVSAFIREAGTILNEQGAWAQKYIGDAVMAIWLHQNDAPDVRDMFAVFRALAKIFDTAAGLQSQFGLETSIRIGAGVNTGPACVGNMGSEAAADYTALSDAVNLAFRLESATKDLGCDVALGRTTYEFLAQQASVGDLFEAHAVQLKGYREPKPVHATTQASVGILLDGLQQKLSPEITGKSGA